MDHSYEKELEKKLNAANKQIEQLKSQNESLQWLIDKNNTPGETSSYIPFYGDVTQLNTKRTILDAVGKETLSALASDLMDLLDTSVAVYEINGDYAYGVFNSAWCQLMDKASRKLCNTNNNKKALECGKWLCHDNCWNVSAKKAITTGKPTDIRCIGGINLYAEPIFYNQRVIGAINIGYGNPPKDIDTLTKLAEKFHLSIDEISQKAKEYKPRPNFIIQVAKKRLKSIAKLIGEIVSRKFMQAELEESRKKFKRLINELPSIVYIFNKDKGATFWSDRVKDILKFTPSELQKDPYKWTNAIHKEDSAKINKLLSTIKENNSFDIEYRIFDANKKMHWLRDSGFCYKNNDGELIIQGVASDISKRKKAEETLVENEKKVRTKLDALLIPSGDIGELHLEDIIDAEKIQLLINDFYKLTNIGIGILDTNGKILVKAGWQDICTKFHRIHPETNKNCLESDRLLSKGVEKGKIKLYKCKNNMWDIATPIIIGEKHMGNVFLGQFFFENEEINFDNFRLQAKKYGFNENEYITALKQVPIFKKETVYTVLNFYIKLAGIISELSHSNLKLAKTLSLRKQTELELEENRETLTIVLENIPFAVFAHGMDGKFAIVNKTASNYSGYSREELLNMTVADIDKESVTRNDRENIWKKLHYGGIETLYSKHYRKNGSTYPVEISLTAITLKNEPVLIAVVQDITKRLQIENDLKESEEKYRLLAENMIDMVAIHKPNGIYTYVSPSVKNILGYTPSELIGINPYTLFHPEDQKHIKEKSHDLALKGEIITSNEYRIKNKAGQYVWFNTNTKPIYNKNNTLVSLQTVSRDITEQKKAQKLKNELLVAQQSAKLKERFLANISHEMRTPMNGVIGMTEFLSNTKLDDHQKDYVNTIKESSESLLHIINDVLSLSRIEQGEVELSEETVCISDMINHSINLFKAEALRKNIKITYNPGKNLPSALVLDKQNFRQILYNLLSNANKSDFIIL